MAKDKKRIVLNKTKEGKHVNIFLIFTMVILMAVLSLGSLAAPDREKSDDISKQVEGSALHVPLKDQSAGSPDLKKWHHVDPVFPLHSGSMIIPVGKEEEVDESPDIKEIEHEARLSHHFLCWTFND